MQFPKFIKKGQKVAFVAPSFGCTFEPYKSCLEESLRKFEAMGYKTECGQCCFLDDGVGISSSPKKCGSELTSMALGQSQALISVGGGELMCEVLDYVDFKAISQAEPKWFMGYSDNTNFSFLLTSMCDIASIYGPNAGAFAMRPWHKSLDYALGLLDGNAFDEKTGKAVFDGFDKWEKESLKSPENPYAGLNLTQESKIKYEIPESMSKDSSATFAKQEAEDKQTAEDKQAAKDKQGNEEYTFSGRLIGGCMDCLNNLVGTKYDHIKAFNEKYKEDGIIWLLEACDLSVLDIRRTLWHMKEAGWFEGAKGFVIGRPYHFDEPIMGLDRYEAVMSQLRELEVPVLMDADVGHISPQMPLVLGSMAQVKLKEDSYQIEMSLK